MPSKPRRGRPALPRQRGAGGVRLLIISVDAPFFVSHFLALAEAAQSAGYDVHIATPIDSESGRRDADAVRRLTDLGFAFHPISLRRASANPLHELSLIGDIYELVAKLSPDIVHGIGIKPVLWAGAIARLRGTPAVHTLVGLGLPFMGDGSIAVLRHNLILRTLGLVFANHRCRVTVEHEADRALLTRAKAVDPCRLALLGGIGIDLEEFHPRDLEQSRSGAAPVAMFASRLIEPKGVRDFVAAARRIKARNVPARFVLQCELDLQSRAAITESEVRAWHDEKTIEWWGCTADMPAALRCADIFCLPTYYREGVPKVLIEAAATGLPIVTSDLPGCRDVVHHGHNGLLVPPRDAVALETALMRVLTDAEFRRQAGEASRRIAVEKYAVESYVRNVLGLYLAALGLSPAEA